MLAGTLKARDLAAARADAGRPRPGRHLRDPADDRPRARHDHEPGGDRAAARGDRRGRLLRHADLRPGAALPRAGRAGSSMEDALKAATHPHDFKLLVASDGQRAHLGRGGVRARSATAQPAVSGAPGRTRSAEPHAALVAHVVRAAGRAARLAVLEARRRCRPGPVRRGHRGRASWRTRARLASARRRQLAENSSTQRDQDRPPRSRPARPCPSARWSGCRGGARAGSRTGTVSVRARRGGADRHPHARPLAGRAPGAAPRADDQHVVTSRRAEPAALTATRSTCRGARSKESTSDAGSRMSLSGVKRRSRGCRSPSACAARARGRGGTRNVTGPKSRISCSSACEAAERRRRTRCPRRSRARARRPAASRATPCSPARSRATMCSGIDGGAAPTVPAIEADRVAGDGALHVPAGRGELVGDRAEVRDAERVLDHREDVGVLQEQRAPAEPVERVPEGPDVRRRRGRSPSRSRRARGRRSRSRPPPRRPGRRSCGRVAAERAGGRHQQRAPGARGPPR